MSPLPAVFIECEACGQSFKRDSLKRRFCDKSCAKRGASNPSWKGGRSTDPRGYVAVATGHGPRRQEHVVVAERALGRPLPSGAEVHHHNGIRTDNRGANLVICQDRYYHRSLEARRRVQLAGGRPFLDALCSSCGPRPFNDFTKFISRGRAARANICRACRRSKASRRAA